MQGTRWYTAKDVLQDLADMTGFRGTDEGFILRGQRPPPPPCQVAEEDEEIQLMFGRAGDHEVAAGPPVKPDLVGITEMLRMVDTFESKSTSSNVDSSQSSSPVKFLISKLNPNVQEFVPRRATNSPCSEPRKASTKRNINKANNNIILEDKVEIGPPLIETTKETSNVSTVDYSKILEEKLKFELKNKIIESTNASTMREKRDRNVALMNLMKLNSAPSSATGSPRRTLPNSNTPFSSGSNSPKPVLIPPEYFENVPCSTINLHIDDGEHSTSPTEDQSKTTSSLNDSSGDVTDLSSSADVSTDLTSGATASNDLTPSADVSTILTSDASVEPGDREGHLTNKVLDPQMKVSIDKVNNWLDKPTKRILLSPNIGPVIYRRKESPKKPHEAPEIKPKPFVGIPAYVPSKDASELAKKYEEQSRAKTVAATDIWTKLEMDLKAKDQEIMRNLKQQSEDEGVRSSPSPTSRSSGRRRNIELE